jgi:hypothetical protein
MGMEEAGDGNRTHMTSLEGWGFTIKLHPHTLDIVVTNIFSYKEVFTADVS